MSSDPGVSSYVDISEEAFDIFFSESGRDRKLSGHNWVLQLLLSNAMGTSAAIRMLATWSRPNEALVLLGTRLEQIFVSSYLVHEEEEKGVKPFVSFLPKIEDGWNRTLEKIDMTREGIDLLFPEMGAHLPRLIEKIDASAEKSFDFTDGNFRRKWTGRSLQEIVKRRDELVDRSDLISSYSLDYYFDTVYRLTGALVHSDSASISPAFIIAGSDGSTRPHEVYVLSSLIVNAHLDIIQCHEISKRLHLLNEKKYFELYEKYMKRVKLDFSLSE